MEYLYGQLLIMTTPVLCGRGCGQPTKVARQTKGIAVAGQPQKFLRFHHHRVRSTRTYRHRGEAPLHRRLAGEALGRSLPPKAVIHHVDGTRSEQSPLVICENQKYHFLLHVRERVRRAGGNPNTDRICYTCKSIVAINEFTGWCQRHEHWRWCKTCKSRLDREGKQRRRALAVAS